MAILDRFEKTREQLNTWKNEGLEQIKSRTEGLADPLDKITREGSEVLKSTREKFTEGQQAVLDARETLKKQGTEVLDSGRAQVLQLEATVLESARDALGKAADTLGERAPFLRRGYAALDDALVDLRAGHAATLPIEGYDDLSVKKVKLVLDDLDLAGLRTVRAYEAAHKNRKTLARELDGRIQAFEADATDEVGEEVAAPVEPTVDDAPASDEASASDEAPAADEDVAEADDDEADDNE